MATPITLQVFRGDQLLRTEQFTRDIIKIGRLATAHLPLDDDRVSRIHAVIEVAADGAISVIDMGSAEGTFVNGRKVSRSPIKAGDQLTVGGLRIALVVEGGAVAAPVPAAPVPTAAPAPPGGPCSGCGHGGSPGSGCRHGGSRRSGCCHGGSSGSGQRSTRASARARRRRASPGTCASARALGGTRARAHVRPARQEGLAAPTRRRLGRGDLGRPRRRAQAVVG